MTDINRVPPSFIWFFKLAFNKAFIRSHSIQNTMISFAHLSREPVYLWPQPHLLLFPNSPPACMNLYSPWEQHFTFAWSFSVLIVFPCVRLLTSISFTILCSLSTPYLDCVFPLTTKFVYPKTSYLCSLPFLKILLIALWSSVAHRSSY